MSTWTKQRQFADKLVVRREEVNRPPNSKLTGAEDRFFDRRRCRMNWDQVKGNWKQFRGQVKEKWGKLTDDELDVIDGKRDQLAGKIQERYGYAKEEAENQIKEFEKSCHC
jgi:uncharacterized protein YjbJ (UPF0337 family)